MLPGLQFTDFHKFLVSVGGLICVAALALPVWLFRTQSTLMINDKQIQELTPTARRAVARQQVQASFLIRQWPWVSGTCLIVGVAFVATGAKTWKRRQDSLDHREAAEIEKIKAEREKTFQETVILLQQHKVTAAEAAEEKSYETGEAGGADADQEMPADAAASGSATTEESSGSQKAQLRTESAASEGERIPIQTPRAAQGIATGRGYSVSVAQFRHLAEDSLVTALADQLGGLVNVVRDVRIGPAFVDLAVTSRTNTIPSMFVDVTALRRNSLRKNMRNVIDQSIAWSVRVSASADKDVGRGFQHVVVLFIEPSADPEDTERDVRSMALDLAAEIQPLAGAADVPTFFVATPDSIDLTKLITQLKSSRPSPVVL